MAFRFRTAMHRVMFGARHREHVIRVVTLDTLHKLDSDLAREIGIFPVSLLATAPARIAENVDVRRPVSQAIPPFGITVMFCSVVVELRAALNADDSSLLMKQFGIPRRRAANWFRKNCRRPVVGHAV